MRLSMAACRSVSLGRLYRRVEWVALAATGERVEFG